MSDTPLLDNIEIKTAVTNLQNKFVAFLKSLKELEDLRGQLEISTYREYQSFKEELLLKKEEVLQMINNINYMLNKLSEAEIKDAKLINENYKKKIAIVRDKFPSKKKDYESILNSIKQKENEFSLRESFNSISSYGNEGIKTISDDRERDKYQIQEYNDQKFLNERQEIIEDVKGISGKIRELSNDIKTTTFQQGEMMGQIEENVDEIKENTKKAEEDIKEVNEITRKQRKRVVYLVIIMIILIFIIIYLFCKFGSSSKKG